MPVKRQLMLSTRGRKALFERAPQAYFHRGSGFALLGGLESHTRLITVFWMSKGKLVQAGIGPGADELVVVPAAGKHETQDHIASIARQVDIREDLETMQPGLPA
ncbi:hypothetical protein SAMN05877838_3837 [Hoeflea halophila]|uniref:Uncharacterized protein n=1 Tax=Hoeflea halophila TaxID=714899 RepID=A0A286IFN9_9HYPH|nr:hypothetical protein SAMN05877838_3837 [Hoeflea halophila]